MTTAEETETLREVIREGHQLLKDLKQERKSIEELFEKYFVAKLETRLDELTEQALAKYASTVLVATTSATEAVYKRFDTIVNLMLGKGKSTDIEELAVQNARAREEYVRKIQSSS